MSHPASTSTDQAIPQGEAGPGLPGTTPAATRRRAGLTILGLGGAAAIGAGVEVDDGVVRLSGVEGPPCTLRAVLGDHLCPGCGMTRSVASSIQGKPAAAIALNPAGPVAVGLGVVAALLAVVALWRGRRFVFEPALGRWMRGTLFVAVAAVGVLRWSCLQG